MINDMARAETFEKIWMAMRRCGCSDLEIEMQKGWLAFAFYDVREECAKAVDYHADRLRSPYGCDPAIRQAIQNAAAAIRALSPPAFEKEAGGLERALVEIEHHSTDKNAAATARAALAVHGKGESGK